MFESFKLSDILLKNRFVRSATWEGLAENGKVTDKLIQLYEKLAENEIGLLITGFITVSANGEMNNRQLAIHNDSFLPGLKNLVKAVHDFEGKIAAQLAHCGGQAVLPLAPSAVTAPFYKKLPEELDREKILKIENDFQDAAKRAVDAGFDAIQIHAAHGYLISQFLSPFTNRRNDEYGGNLENRMRLLVEIYKKIRKTVGDNYPVLIKINAEDFIENGLTFEDCIKILKYMDNMGLNGVEISGGLRGALKTPILTGIDSSEKEGYWKDYAKEVKKFLKMPVILVGGLRSYNVIKELFQKNYADLFSLSRPFIKEPDLVKKWSMNNFEKSKCKSCNKCFIPAYKGEGIRCMLT